MLGADAPENGRLVQELADAHVGDRQQPSEQVEQVGRGLVRTEPGVDSSNRGEVKPEAALERSRREERRRWTEREEPWTAAAGGSLCSEQSVEGTAESDAEELVPVMTQFRMMLFSQHESSVRVIKEHQYLVHTVLLLGEQIRRENQALQAELCVLLRLSPRRENRVYELVGRLLLPRPSHLMRKQHELRIFQNRRQLRCLDSKMVYLEKVMLEEKARARSRVNRLQRNYQRQRDD